MEMLKAHLQGAEQHIACQKEKVGEPCATMETETTENKPLCKAPDSFRVELSEQEQSAAISKNSRLRKSLMLMQGLMEEQDARRRREWKQGRRNWQPSLPSSRVRKRSVRPSREKLSRCRKS